MLSSLLRNTGIRLKLITPSIVIIFGLVAFVYFLADLFIEKTIDKSVRLRAGEIAETFNISIEADNSLANITRTNNSVATFEDVDYLFVVDGASENVIVSSDNIYSKKQISSVSDAGLQKIFKAALRSDENQFYKLDNEHYVYNYHFIVKSENDLSFKKLKLIVVLNSKHLIELFHKHQNALLMLFVAVVLLSMLAFYFRTEKVVLTPLRELLIAINENKTKETPVVYKYKENDELGRVISTYNDMVLSESAAKQRLIEARDASDAAAKAKGEFLSVMSHEIRTPLNGVVGGCHFLEKTELNEDQKRHTAMINSSVQQLLSLVNDILDFSKIEAGKIELDEDAVDIPELVEQVMFLFDHNVKEKNIRFEFNKNYQAIPYVLADPVRLKQILINLVSNAVKFTTDGSITIDLGNVHEVNDKVSFELSVNDTGVGIKPEKIGQLFNPFTQADSSTTRNYGGTGLGLAISKQLVDKMGGEIRIKSQPGHGSSFVISLTLTKTERLPEKESVDNKAGEQALPSAKILLVEDTEVNQIIATELLQGLGQEVVLAKNGQEAVDAVKKESFDVILMDCFMPVMDGYEASRLIRIIDTEENRQAIPIIALTADATTENQKKCLAAGMDDFLIKPYEPAALVAVLSKYLG